MKKFITVILLTILSTSIYAKPALISGKVIDENDAVVPFATVALYKVDGEKVSMVKATFSDENGSYSFSGFGAGKYYLEASFVGFTKTKTETIEFDGKTTFAVPTIQMKSTAQVLEGVEVRAERELVEVKPDKTVFNVKGSINATGNTALELLRKSPGVVVDNNDNLMLQGKNGVQVYIDGKRSPLSGDDLANYLKTLQSNEIDAIEIITDPSAKYDAEGNAGIINIRLAKDKSLGTNGSVNAGFRYGINPKYNGSVSFNNRNKKMNIYGNFSAFNGDFESEMELDRQQSGNRFEQDSKTISTNESYGYKFGADFFLSKKSTLGFIVNGNINTNTNNSNSDTDIMPIGSTEIDSMLIASNNVDGERDNTNINLNYALNLSKGRSLNIDIDYGTFKNRNTSFQPNRYFLPDGQTLLSENIFSIVTPADIDIYTAKFDWESKLFDGKFGFGAKYSFVKSDNTIDNFDIVDGQRIKNLEQSNNFVYDEKVSAVYISYQKKLNDKWNLMTGLRMEYTNAVGVLTVEDPSKAEDDAYNDYVNWFPSAGLTYKANEKNSFRLNYSRRIDRPNYQDLNPFQFKLDELTFQQGNPELQPQYSNSFSFTHTYKSLLNTSINYTEIDQVSTRITEQLDDRTAILTFVNLAKQSNLALTVSYPFNVKKWWNVYATFTGYRLRNEAAIENEVINPETNETETEINEIDLVTNSFNFYIQNTFSLPKGLKFELSGWYNAPAIWAGNWTTDSQFDVTAGVSKQVLNKRGNIKVSVSDIFLQNPWSGESTFGGLFIEGNGRWESRQVRFNFSYRFGSNTVKKSRRRKTGMDDLQKRVGSSQ